MPKVFMVKSSLVFLTCHINITLLTFLLIFSLSKSSAETSILNDWLMGILYVSGVFFNIYVILDADRKWDVIVMYLRYYASLGRMIQQEARSRFFSFLHASPRFLCTLRRSLTEAAESVRRKDSSVFSSPKPLNADPIRTKPLDADSIRPKPLNADPIRQKQLDANPIRQKPLNAEPIRQKPLDANPIRSKPSEAVLRNIERVESQGISRKVEKEESQAVSKCIERFLKEDTTSELNVTYSRPVCRPKSDPIRKIVKSKECMKSQSPELFKNKIYKSRMNLTTDPAFPKLELNEK